MDPLSYQQYLDQLITFGSAEARKPDLLEARAEFTRLTGEVFEDDKAFDMRMASFLEFYLLDRTSPLTRQTPAQEMYEHYLREGPPEQANVFRSFTETVHALFEVRKLAKE